MHFIMFVKYKVYISVFAIIYGLPVRVHVITLVHYIYTNLLLVISDFMCNSIYGNRLFSNLISTNAN